MPGRGQGTWAGSGWYRRSRPRAAAGAGRSWSTPVGNLAASLLLVVEHEPSVAATLGFVAGLALDEALRAVAPSLAVRIALDGIEGGASSQRDRLQLKWPNDVLLDGAKLAGILLEAEPLGGERLAVIVGIGANVVAAPSGLPYPATSLRDAQRPGRMPPRLFRALSDAWAALERIWNDGRGFRDDPPLVARPRRGNRRTGCRTRR